MNDAEREAHAIGRRARRLIYCVGRRHQERLRDNLMELVALADPIDADHVAGPAGMLSSPRFAWPIRRSAALGWYKIQVLCTYL